MTEERQASFLRRRVRQAFTLLPGASPSRISGRLALPAPLLRRGLIGLLFGAGGAGALSLGEIGLQSHLGEPLRASIPVTLQNGEMLDERCVATRAPSQSAAAVPDVRLAVPATVRPGRHEIRLSSAAPLHEPLYELELQVDCAGSPRSIREYVLMLDPPGRAPFSTQTAAAAPAPAAAAPPTPRSLPRVAPRAAPRRPSPAAPPRTTTRPAETPPASGYAYRVSSGDTLYGIARRASGYSGTALWGLVDRIHEANPAAFVDGDPTRIRLGAEILIPLPTAAGTEAMTRAAATPPAPMRQQAPASPAEVTPPIDIVQASSTGSAVAPPITSPPEVPQPAREASASPKPIVPGAAGFAPAAVPVEKAPVRTGRPTAARPFRSPPAAQPGGPSVEILAGVAVALLLSLLLWSRPIAELFSSWRHGVRLQAQPHPARRASDRQAGDVAATLPALRPRDSAGIEVTRVEELDTSAAEWFAAAEPEDADDGDISAELSGLFEAGKPPAEDLGPDDDVGDFAETVVEQPMLRADDGTVPSTAALADMETLLTTPVDREVSEWGTGQTRNPRVLGATAPGANGETDYTGVDLQTLAIQAEGDDRMSRTLMDALLLLERDYQEELTGSRLEQLRVAEDEQAEGAAETDEPGNTRPTRDRRVG